MDELYKIHEYTTLPISSNSNLLEDGNYANYSTYGFMSDHHHHQEPQVVLTTTGESSSLAHHPMEMSDHVFKAQIATHPLYSNLISAYIQCTKVGAPREVVSLLEEISQENQHISNCTEIGADPELDEFMISYCELLHKYKEELSKPIDEATSFLSSIQTQLTNLCGETLPQTTNSSLDGEGCHGLDEDGAGGSEEFEDTSRQGSHELKDMLLRKYSGYLSTLKTDFLKKRRKGKLPKDARVALLDWWNSHYRWPYPTEEEKSRLSDQTGLDHKQISNWFINQRKRHWKPSEEMRFALDMEVANSGVNKETMYYDHAAQGNFQRLSTEP